MLTADRNTLARDARDFEFPVASGVKLFAGAICCIDTATGFATPGDVSTTLFPVGRVKETVDNTNGNDGDVTVKVERGCFRYGNSAAADEITLADVGAAPYIVDDATVAKTSDTNTRSAGGVIRDVDANGVWVEF